MIPLVGHVNELKGRPHQPWRRVAKQVTEAHGETIDYMFGTMIEIPRAALTSDEIAEEAEFFSFGTNDLDADDLRLLARRLGQVPEALCRPEDPPWRPLRVH